MNKITMEKMVYVNNMVLYFKGRKYGGLANTWDYGPLGMAKNNLKMHGEKGLFKREKKIVMK